MSNRFPTLRQRINVAKEALPHSPIIQGAANSSIKFIIDPAVAKTAFANHELVNKSVDNGSSSDSDTSSSKNGADNTTSTRTRSIPQVNLEKPTKPTKLLHHALTNANGDIWRRQRYCVSRAFAVDKALRTSCANYAVEKMMELINKEKQPSVRCRPCIFSRKRMGVDVRILAREVAIHTMSRMVLGHARGSNVLVIDSLRELVDCTLAPRRDEEFSKVTRTIVECLDRTVRDIVAEIAEDGTGSDCLVRRLLLYEKDPAVEKYITRDEVIGNAHSAMLAGTQTICTVIAGALSHLAERLDLQHDLRQGRISGKDIVMETLRILPPVAGLPRIPTGGDLELKPNESENDGNGCCPIQQGQVMVVDLLAFAHAQPLGVDDALSLLENTSNSTVCTFKFDPGNRTKSQAQPWGIGKRKCPAGIISTECISTVIEALAKSGITWEFANPHVDSVGKNEFGGWMKSISYRPTLSYSAPIRINFHVD